MSKFLAGWGDSSHPSSAGKTPPSVNVIQILFDFAYSIFQVIFSEKNLASSLKLDLVFSHQSFAEEKLFFVLLIKKEKSLMLRRTQAYIKENY